MSGGLEMIVKMFFAFFLYFFLEFQILFWEFLKCQGYFSVV